MGKTIEVKTPEGVADSYLTRPDDGRAHPGVLLLVDAFGLRPQIEAMADRIAAGGYVVLAPNVFYRAGKAPVMTAMLPTKPLSSTWPKPEMPSGKVMPLMRY